MKVLTIDPDAYPNAWGRPAGLALIAALRHNSNAVAQAFAMIDPDDLPWAMCAWIDTMLAAQDLGPEQWCGHAECTKTRHYDAATHEPVALRDLPKEIRLTERLVRCRMHRDQEGFENLVVGAAEDGVESYVEMGLAVLTTTAETLLGLAAQGRLVIPDGLT